MSNDEHAAAPLEQKEQRSGGTADEGDVDVRIKSEKQQVALSATPRRRRGTLRLLWLLLLSSFVLVTAACFCIWLIGHMSADLLSTQLMGQLRRSLLADIHS